MSSQNQELDVSNLNNSTRYIFDRLRNTVSHVKRHYIQILTICALLLAIGVSVYNIAVRDRLKKTQEFREEMRGDMTSMDERIDAFSKEFDGFKTTLTGELEDLKTSVDEKMNTFSKDLINVQSGISGLKSNVQDLREDVGSVGSSMEQEKAKVWAEFKKLEKEIDNLPKNKGNSQLLMNKTLAIFIIIVTMTFGW